MATTCVNDVNSGIFYPIYGELFIRCPVSPSPQAAASNVSTEATALKNTASEETSTTSAGVNLFIQPKSTWNADQMSQAEAKVGALTDAETVVTKNPVSRDANLRSKFIKSGGQVSSSQDVDHIVDLQLGGSNATSNLQSLDKSVNRSIGKQLQLQMKTLPDNTRVNKVILLDQLPPKKKN